MPKISGRGGSLKTIRPFTGHSLLLQVCSAASVQALKAADLGTTQSIMLRSLLLLLWCLQNLREAIATYRGRLMAETKESRRATLMAVCIEYLER